MTKFLKFVFVLLLSSTLLAACSTVANQIPMAESGKMTRLPAEQYQITNTSEIAPEPTISPEPTATQEPTPSPTPSYFELAKTPINSQSIQHLEKLETFGKGRIYRKEFHPETSVFILQTTLGIYLYDASSLNQLAFFENYRDFFMIPAVSQMVAISPDLDINLIDLNNGNIVQTMSPKKITGIGLIAFSQNGKTMAVMGSQDHDIRADWEEYRIDIWDLENNRQISTLKSDLFGVCSAMAFSEDSSLLVADCYTADFSMYRKLVMWNVLDENIVWYLSNEGSFTTYPFTKDGSLLATYTATKEEYNQVVIRRTDNGAEIGRVVGKLSDNPFSHDNQHIVTSSLFQQVRVWNITSSQAVKTIQTGLDWPSASYSEDGQFILLNNGEHAYSIDDYELNPDFPESQHSIPQISLSQWHQLGHLSDIHGIQLTDDNHLMVWGFGENEFIWRWLPETDVYDLLSIGTGKSDPVLSPDAQTYAICTEEGLKLVSFERGLIQSYDICKGDQIHLVFSRDGSRIHLSSGILINEILLENGDITQQIRSHNFNVGPILISDDGNYMVSSSMEIIQGGCETIFWEVNPTRFVRKWLIPVEFFFGQCLIDIAIDLNQSHLVTVHDKVAVWRISDGWYLKYFNGTAAAFSNDDSLLAVGTEESQIEYYDTYRWELIETFGDPDIRISFSILDFFRYYSSERDYVALPTRFGIILLKFLHDGQVLVSVTDNDVITVWGIP